MDISEKIGKHPVIAGLGAVALLGLLYWIYKKRQGANVSTSQAQGGGGTVPMYSADFLTGALETDFANMQAAYAQGLNAQAMGAAASTSQQYSSLQAQINALEQLFASSPGGSMNQQTYNNSNTSSSTGGSAPVTPVATMSPITPTKVVGTGTLFFGGVPASTQTVLGPTTTGQETYTVSNTMATNAAGGVTPNAPVVPINQRIAGERYNALGQVIA